MIVPEHWAEARLQVRRNGRSVTVRRFGWSDESVLAAQAHADERVKAALDAILAGKKLPRREPLSNYGRLGIPIREQIVERHGDVVVTRNSYGARCLNTPDVLFADVDFDAPPTGCALPFAVGAIVWAAVFMFVALTLGKGAFLGVFAGVVSLIAVNAVVIAWKRATFGRNGGPEGRALKLVQAFSSRNPDWHLRAYRTPAGLRVLVMHQTFGPTDAGVAGFFHALRADGLYASMCVVQQCFRARLTAKPWRIGMEKRIRPRYAAWSVAQASRPDRLQWIAEYEQKAARFAACRYVKSFGNTACVDSKAELVRGLHDAMAGADTALPIA